MEEAKKLCKKKRKLAKSIFSLMLVFAMVISNVQIAPEAFATVWAAESETAISGETAEASEVSEGSGQNTEAAQDEKQADPASVSSGDDKNTGTEKTETIDKSSEKESVKSEEAAETENVQKTDEKTEETESNQKTDEGNKTEETENNKKTDEDNKTEETTEEKTTAEDETKTTDTTNTETESITESTEISESTENAETEETTEESSKDNNEGDTTPAEDQVNVILHYKNSYGWSDVAAYFGKHNGEGWDGDALSGSWPGITGDNLQKDANGYYTVSCEIPKSSGFIIIFNNNNSESNEQAQDIIIPSTEFTDVTTYERWVWIERYDGAEPQYFLSTTPVISPEVNDGIVTFRYKNESAKSVKLAGEMTGWAENAIEMTKDANGIFTYTMEEALTPGEHQYKFIVDDKWICDPNNDIVKSNNSIVMIEGEDPNKVISPEVNGNKVTFRYKNSEAENVYVRGLQISDWAVTDDYKMTKDEETGIHSVEIELPHGGYEYKFWYKDSSGAEQWIADPNNEQVVGSTGNSYVFVSGSKEYEYTIHYYNPNADVPTSAAGPDLHIWDECSPEDMVGDYKFTEITKDAEEEGKTWLTMKVKLPYPHITAIARPKGNWDEQDKEYKYEITSGEKAELWYVYGKGIYDKNPFLASFEYTIHYFNPDAPDQASDQSDLYIWEPGTSNPGGVFAFDESLVYDDFDNDITWLTAEVGVPYASIGVIGKPYAGEENWDDKDSDRKYQLKGEAKEAELWYVHGVGIYEEKPNLNLESIEASLQLDSMDYTQNNVLTIIANGDKNSDVLVKSAYVDASELGISSKLVISPELMAVSLSVRDNIAAGTYELPVTVEDVRGNQLQTKATVNVTQKADGENDFNWDESVIYFMVTDRFFDGNEGNNEANGKDGDYNTYGKDNQGLYHGGDFAGVTAKLDYLKDLGVNTIWITPIVENVKGVTVGGEGKDKVPYYAGYHGYWASDFTKLNPALGTEEEFETLINTAHEKGMKIMVDVVVNHAGYGMEDTDKFAGMLRDSKDVVEDNHELGGYQAGLPDFLTEIPEVRDQIIEWQVNWAKKGVDYFRVDTVQHVDDTTWMAFKNALTEANPNFKMIGEYFGAGYNSANGGRLGSGQMDSLLDFNFNEWATDFVNGKISSIENNLANRNKALNNTYLTGQFLSSHDENGFQQELKNKGWSADAAIAASYVAATLQITAKGQPVIYYGEEIGLSGNNDYPYQTNRYDFNWNELDKQKSQDSSIYNHYKKMLAIRKEYSDVFAKGNRQVVIQSDADGYDVVSRSYQDTTLYIGMNIKSSARTLKIPVDGNGITGYKDLYSGKTYPVAADNKIEVAIPAAANGGTVVLVADTYKAGLIAPELTIAKGKESALPAQLTKLSEDGKKELVDVTYSMTAVEGVTLNDKNKKITIAETFIGKTVELTATAGSDTVAITIKVVEDKNEITVRLHYNRPDHNYTGWNVWTWGDGSSAVVQFTSDDEAGGKVAEIKLEGRTASVMNYIIRKSTESNEWEEKDPGMDCYIDLSDILSGTVDYYVASGQFPGTRVLGDDVLIGVKIRSAVYNSSKNVVKVQTGIPIPGTLDGIFTLKTKTKDESEKETIIPITAVRLVNAEENTYELSLGVDLTSAEAMAKEYVLVYDGQDYNVSMPSLYSSEVFESQYTYTGDDLGATWTSSKTTFKVWAPTAEKVQVNLYESGTEGTDDLIKTLDMIKGDKGVWSVSEAGDLNGTYYTYKATINGEEQAEACDPYAKTTGVNGNRAMVINMNATNPAGWASDRGPNAGMSYTDSIIYELHVRDFSIDESSGISEKNKGKFLGLTETGTKNKSGQTTGLDYLTDLGITHIHLLPSYDYATVDETKLDTPQYNWGYDPKNYNVPEGSYSTDPYNGAVRVKEMKQMVKTLHDNNINVIMDVVYNHVYDADKFSFNQIVPKYFSRTNADGTYSSGSGCGNDTASERAMVRKYIVDSVNYWADEYHIDGFRFDLVGLLDTETINEVVDSVHENHPDVVFYGEGWTMDTALSKDNITMATQTNSTKTPKFAYFSDTIRDAIKGDNFNAGNTGFVQGADGKESILAGCFVAATSWCKSPTQTINYASCHDNYTLWDKISVSQPDTSLADRIKMNNLSAAIYMTSEGIPLIHAAEELLRTKVDEKGEIIHNSYNSSDFVNSIKWSDLDKEEYRAVRDYYKGLIQFRKNHAALRLTSARDINANVKYKEVGKQVMLFVINGKDRIKNEVSDGIVVIFNAANSEKEIDLYKYGVVKGDWNVCINDKFAGIKTLDTIKDGKVKVAPISAMVLVKGEGTDNDSIYGDNEQQKIEHLRKELQDIIAIYEKLQKADYTEESWNAFTGALDAARKAVAEQTATLNSLNKAKENLLSAYNALAVPEGKVDAEKLRVLTEVCEAVKEQGQGYYTEESWNAFITALEAAKSVLEKSDAVQTEVDEAYKRLDSAYNGLTKKKPDLSVLKELIAEYENIEKGNYTDESWKAFTDALEAAKLIITEPDIGQDEIDTAIDALKKAFEGLEVPEGTVDTGKLKALIAHCKEIRAEGQGSYTDESWSVFTSALKKAEDILKKADVTQKEVNDAYTALSKARRELSEVHKGLWTKWDKNAGIKLGEDGKYHISYTGKALKPAILVFDGETQLKEKTDYTVGYKNNTNAGTASLIIKGKGNYNLSRTVNFEIDKVDIKNIPIADLYAAVAANNSKQVVPKPVVKYNGKALKLNKDYTATYDESSDGKTLGVHTVKITAKPDSKNFKGETTIRMILVDKAKVPLISKATIKIPQPQQYNEGKVLEPSITVIYKGQTLRENEHYTVEYDKVHTEAGETATIVVKGIIGENFDIGYAGEKTASFKINGTPLKAKMVSFEDANIAKAGLVYTGVAQEPKILVEGAKSDQYKVEYQNNINAGKATVIVTGKKGYSGTVKKTFKITPFDISVNNENFAYASNISVPYAKGGAKLSDKDLNARFNLKDDKGTFIKTEQLQQGKDLTLTYKNNKATGSAALFSIKGKGNFKGTIKDISFTITPQDLSKLKITAADILESKAKNFNKVVPVITDLDGKKLKKNTDFTCEYVYGDNQTSGTPSVNTTVKLTAKAAGSNYTGSIITEFRVIAKEKNIAKASVTINNGNPYIYTGSAIRPDKNAIRVTLNGTLSNDDYEIVEYSNNIKKGTAKLTIHGLGEYGGTKTVTFKITAQPMNR